MGSITSEGNLRDATGAGLPSQTPVGDNGAELFQIMEMSQNKTVRLLGAVADELTKGGAPISQSALMYLQGAAKTELGNPQLSPPVQALLSCFIDKMGSMPVARPGPGGPRSEPGLSLPIANNWLNNRAFVEVCEQLYEITTTLSMIKLSESQLQIIMQKINAEMAKNIASAIQASGQLSAEMSMNNAYKELASAGAAMTGIVLAGLTTVAREVLILKGIDQWRQGPPERAATAKPTGTDLMAIQKTAGDKVELISSLSQQLPTIINGFASASVSTKNSILELLKAQSEATQTELSKLADLMKGTIDALRGDQSELSQEITKFLDNFLSAFSKGRLAGGR